MHAKVYGVFKMGGQHSCVQTGFEAFKEDAGRMGKSKAEQPTNSLKQKVEEISKRMETSTTHSIQRLVNRRRPGACQLVGGSCTNPGQQGAS